jgi:2-aminoethylphosphonate-pyruvate transaminase
MILLNPGPVSLTAGVREALGGPDLCHREPEFGDLQTLIRQRLLEVYGLSANEWAAVLLAGSGTAAVEALLTTLAPRDGKLLVIENGVYGERMSAIAKVHGIGHHALTHAWGAPIRISDVYHALDVDCSISHLAVVQHETTTGRLNDLAELGALCRARSKVLLVDGVSSFGAEALDFERWGIAGCAATANKCLHGAPGVSFAVVRRDQLPAADATARTLYLDLANYCREQDRASTPFTQPIQILYALNRALIELKQHSGWRARQARYGALAHNIRESLSVLGIKPVLEEEDSSVVLSAYYLPNGVSYQALHDALKQQGFIIYAGQGELVRSIFRISVMGAIGDDDIDQLVNAIHMVVQAQ